MSYPPRRERQVTTESQRLKSRMDAAGHARQMMEAGEISREEYYDRLDELKRPNRPPTPVMDLLLGTLICAAMVVVFGLVARASAPYGLAYWTATIAAALAGCGLLYAAVRAASMARGRR